MLYSVAKAFFRVLFRLCFRVQVTGVENIPTAGAVVLASNHLSLLDPPLIGTFANRCVRFMAKEELFAYPVFGTIIKELGAFSVRRGSADRRAIQTALAILNEGGIMAIFPEGTRSRSGEVGKALPGALMLAAKSGAAIVPVAVTGTNELSRRHWFPRFSVTYGLPYQLPDINSRQELDAEGDILMEKIRRLKEKKQTAKK